MCESPTIKICSNSLTLSSFWLMQIDLSASRKPSCTSKPNNFSDLCGCDDEHEHQQKIL